MCRIPRRFSARADDSKKYEGLGLAIRRAFHAKLYKGNGVYANGSQTALSCAVYQGLAEPKERALAVARLAENVKQNGDHLDTGILGAKYLFHALSDNGQHDLAYRIATQTTPPSYGDWIRRGATTLWEDWGDGASRNHIMFGDISAWFYQTLGRNQRRSRPTGFQARHHSTAAGRRSEMGAGQARIAVRNHRLPVAAGGRETGGQRHHSPQHHRRSLHSRSNPSRR